MEISKHKMWSLVAHLVMVISLLVDSLMRVVPPGVSHATLAVVGGVLFVSAFLYFVVNPYHFFFIRSPDVTSSCDIRHNFLKTGLSWLFVIFWPVALLLFSDHIPRILATYLMIFCSVTSIIISKYLFPKK